MPHLDEGTLHALLDGELELGQVKEIQTHLGACAACGSRLQDVKEFLAESDRLVGALETPSGTPRARREPGPRPQVPPPLPPDQKIWREPVWDSAPEILLPDDPGEPARQRRWARRLRWAALILVVVGAGQMFRNALTPGAPHLQLSDAEVPAGSQAPAVVSPEETVRPRVPAPVEAPPPPANRTSVPGALPQAKSLADQTAPDTLRPDLEATAAADEDTAPAAAAPVAAGSGTDTSPTPTPQSTPATDEDARREAAAALDELDRERLRARANAATASLPPVRTEPAPAAEPPPPPPPRTLEQKAQIYLRIGLDEAATQLGRPVHAIEGMTPEFMGLAQGRLVPGADPARPVVRVVYRDTRGRMILLDQQRMRTGQAPGAAGGNLRWAIGDVMLYLHGEPGTEVLRNLQRRVR